MVYRAKDAVEVKPPHHRDGRTTTDTLGPFFSHLASTFELEEYQIVSGDGRTILATPPENLRAIFVLVSTPPN